MEQDAKKQNTESLLNQMRDSLKLRSPGANNTNIPLGVHQDVNTASILSDLKVLTGEANNTELAQGFLGTSIGPYVVESIIGEGAFSTVFKVRDKTLGVYRALKLFKLNPVDPMSKDDLDRLKKEARIATFLQHQHICKVHALDYIIHPQHQELSIPYLVMDYVEAEPLRNLMKDFPDRLPEVFCLVIFIQCLEALNYAFHNVVSFVEEQSGIALESQYRSITHRDLKPENILVNKNGAFIIDFGIAATFLNTPRNISVEGFYMGTPAYMAPEIIRGVQLSPEKSFKADLYSMCVVLYELLEGSPPFVALEKGELLQKVQNQNYTKPKCNSEIAHLIQKGMAEKYTSYDEALHDALKILEQYNAANSQQVIRNFFDARENGEEIKEAFKKYHFQTSARTDANNKTVLRKFLLLGILVFMGMAVWVGRFIFNPKPKENGATSVKPQVLKGPQIQPNPQPGVQMPVPQKTEPSLVKAQEKPSRMIRKTGPAPLKTESSYKKLYAQAKSAFAAGNLDKAVEILSDIKDPASDYLQGLIFMKKEDFFNALKCFERITGPSFLEAFSVKDLGYYESAVCYSNLYFQRKRDKYKDEALSRFLDLQNHYQAKIPKTMYERIESRIQLLSKSDE